MSQLEPLPFFEAVQFWSDKIQIGPKAFAALSDRGKVLAFGIARIAKGDELNTAYQLIGKVFYEGWTVDEVKAGAADIFSRRGWTGKNDYKADAIVRTNVRSAFMAGRYQQQTAMVTTHPYWLYSGIEDSRIRPEHRAMSGRVFRWDSPVWKTWYPPNGMNCRCDVIALTDEQVAAMGLTVETDDPTGQTFIPEPIDGEEQKPVTLLPDEGWQLNQSEAYVQAWGTYANRKIQSYPALLQQLVLQDLLTNDDMAILLSGAEIPQETI